MEENFDNTLYFIKTLNHCSKLTIFIFIFLKKFCISKS